MDQLRKRIGFSFKQLEQSLWLLMLEEFSAGLAAVLRQVDDHLFDIRDEARFKSHSFEERSMGTLFGRDVRFRRRRYRDRETGEDVYLLDEVLKIKRHKQASPALMALMLTQAATTNSYRKAAESISSFLGFDAVSHETIRQMVLELGDELESAGAEERKDPRGRRKVDVLFLEADGMWVPLQECSRDRVEEKILTSHEGWEPRYSGSKEYKLRHVRQFRTHERGDFWEEASRSVFSTYDIDDDTIVVINGDRASWIRRGTEYFGNAMYQVDRFHLTRELKRLFRTMPKTHRALLAALDGDDPTGATFIAELGRAVPRIKDEKKREAARNLLNDLAKMPEATVDYRVRLKARGVSVSGLRGLGAAESQVDRFSDRIRGGRSWRHQGLAAMMEMQRIRHEGIFADIIERIEEWSTAEGEVFQETRDTVRRAVRSVITMVSSRLIANVPIKQTGTSASGGLSNLFHRLNESGMPAIT